MNRTKILLISPTKGLFVGNPESPKFQTHPLGLLYIASVLERNHYQVKICDAFSFGNSLDEISKIISDYNPHIVGLTAMTILAKDAYLIAQNIKMINAKIVVVMGGPHATALPQEALNTGWIDFVVIGEGEYSMLEISDRLERQENSFFDIKGIVYKHRNDIIRTLARERKETLDEIPFPAYHLLERMEEYNPPPHWGKKGKFASVITSRGCPYGCIFCSVTRAWGKKYRCRSDENVLRELRMLREEYQAKYISFRDSTLTLNRPRVIRICKGILIQGLDINWNCNSRANEINEEILEWMKKAGCQSIQFGIECGDEELLKKFKNLDKQMIRRAIELTDKFGIKAHGYFMLGLPGETRQTIRETIDFAKSLPLHSAGFTTVTPFPGSELWDYSVENDLVLTRDWSMYNLKGSSVVRYPNFESKDILRKQKQAFREFYLRPRMFFRHFSKIKSLNDLANYITEALVNLK